MPDLSQELKSLLDTNPNLFTKFYAVIVALVNQITGQNVPGVNPIGQPLHVDLTSLDGTGTMYTIQSSTITDEELVAIRKGIADGIVCDKAIEWVKGLITGLAMAGGGA